MKMTEPDGNLQTEPLHVRPQPRMSRKVDGRKGQRLTEMDRRFAQAYVGEARGNATIAARLAGSTGQDASSLGVVGHGLLHKPAVLAEIGRIMVQAEKKGLIPTSDRTLQLLGQMAEADIGDLLDVIPGTGQAVVNLERAKEQDKTRLIREIDWGKRGTRIKLVDAQRAVEKLAEYHRLIPPDVPTVQVAILIDV